MECQQLEVVQKALQEIKQKLEDSQKYVKEAKIGPIRVKKNKFGTEYYYMAYRDSSQNGACANEYLGRVDEVNDSELEHYKNELANYRATKKRIKYYKKVNELLELAETMIVEAEASGEGELISEDMNALMAALKAIKED